MKQVEQEFVRALEARVGKPLRTREEAVDAFCHLEGLDPGGAGAAEEYAIAAGETISGDTQVTVNGVERDDEVDLALSGL